MWGTLANQPEKTYTIKTEDLIELAHSSREELDIAVEVLKYELTEREVSSNMHVISLLSEVVWTNNNILLLMRTSLDDPIFVDEDTKNEIIVPPEIIRTLRTLVLSRSGAQSELSRYSRSICLH